MDPGALISLAERIEADPSYDAGLTRTAFDMVETHLPEVDRAMIRNGALGGVEAVLLIIDHGFPGWAISMQGTASEADGHWTVSLRKSDIRDEDPFVGVGHGPRLSNALIGALLKALARKPAEI